jgi:uncharacterized protein (DUF58 family)
MRLTRRGWVTLGVVAGTVAYGWQFGSRSLNAVAAPLFLAIVLGMISVRRANEPTVTLAGPAPGFPAETGPLECSVDGTGLVTVELTAPEGVEMEPVTATVSLPSRFERTVELQRRGVYAVGPPTITQRGALGLVERQIEQTAIAEVVVYPRPHEVAPESALGRQFAEEFEVERQEFDRIREYEPGDPLKHVHWKTSAKRDEFMVVEFAATERDETVSIAATSDPGRADEMARAAATAAEVGFDAGQSVELTLPEEHVPAGSGMTHRGNLFRLLAETDGGELPATARSDADIVVDASADETRVQIGEYTTTLLRAISKQSQQETQGERETPRHDETQGEVRP